MDKQTCLVDCMNLAYRSHFIFSNLRTEDGRHSGLVYGMLRAVLKLRQQFQDRIAFCWDNGLPGIHKPKTLWRKLCYPGYKAKRDANNRNELLAQTVPQLKAVSQTLRLLGYDNLGVPGLEADDVIGIAVDTKRRWLIYSTDSDFYQLLNPSVEQLKPTRKGDQKITAEDVRREFGFPPSRFAHYLAFGGDKSDNINLVPGFGPKKAKRLAADRTLKLTSEAPSGRSQDDKVMRAVRQNWEKFQLAYRLAHIPRRWNDMRIVKLNPKKHLASFCTRDLSSEQPLQTTKGTLREFEKFCIGWNMQYFLERRHEFFTR